MGSIPVQAWIFFRFLLFTCLNWNIFLRWSVCNSIFIRSSNIWSFYILMFNSNQEHYTNFCSKRIFMFQTCVVMPELKIYSLGFLKKTSNLFSREIRCKKTINDGLAVCIYMRYSEPTVWLGLLSNCKISNGNVFYRATEHLRSL